MAKKNQRTGKSKFFGKLSRNKIIALLAVLVIVIAGFAYYVNAQVGADALLTASCSGKKGKCTEQTTPSPTGNSVQYQVIARDTKTKTELDKYKLYVTDNFKGCYKAGTPGHPKGGCTLGSTSNEYDFQQGTKSTSALCSIDTKYYNGGVEYKKITTYLPCYENNVGKGGNYTLWKNSVYQYRNSEGKVLAKVKVGAPFGYTSNKSKALKALDRQKGKKYYINIKNASEVNGTASTDSTEKSTGTNSTTKYTLVVDNANLRVQYGSFDSKRCTIVVRALGEKDKKLKTASARCGGKGQAIGTYPTITMLNIDPEKTQKIYFWGSDGGAGSGQKKNTFTVDLSKLTSLGTNYSNVHDAGSYTVNGTGISGGDKKESRSLSCKREDNTISCTYAPILN